MKHIHTFEEFLNEGTLNYTQAMELGALSDAVKNHIKTNYSELYYGGGPNNILGKYGKDIPGTSWKKLEKLAKDKGDKDFSPLWNDFVDNFFPKEEMLKNINNHKLNEYIYTYFNKKYTGVDF